MFATAGEKVITQGDIQYHAKKGIELQNGYKIKSERSVHLESSDGALENKGTIVSQGKRGIYI